MSKPAKSAVRKTMAQTSLAMNPVKSGPEIIKLFSYQLELSMKFQLLIKGKI